MESYSKIVAEGMKRACSAFTKIVQPVGFKRGAGRKWVRQIDGLEETIHVSRSGATYGAPYSPSISLQLDLSSTRVSDNKRAYLSRHTTTMIRRPTGYCYHHRFNAETGSTYDRCLQELGLFFEEVAEPWFDERRGELKGQ
ncbi:hypothetical protein OF829_04165 [Sphingomonas sp. LB-2]|uniref:hypothetical protein n=1 Tax=Sphingomonas caeni TaxID=2984949 RepID=UPI0022307FDB|nr:hypothetical protein [Sphingomonas caeni]MCW3846422.1 hypothetical protein [Sphingomonas caeni]